jgi:hypothetical protein
VSTLKQENLMKYVPAKVTPPSQSDTRWVVQSQGKTWFFKKGVDAIDFAMTCDLISLM